MPVDRRWLLIHHPLRQRVPEVWRVFCGTSNVGQVIVAEGEQGRGILGVIDGVSPKGIEDGKGIAWRKGFLRKIGYKG